MANVKEVKQSKDIRVLAYIVAEPNGKPVNYLIRNMKIGAVTGVTLEQLKSMSNGLINIKSIDMASGKVVFTDCASNKVPKVKEGGFGTMDVVKDGIWVVGKYEDCDMYQCLSCTGNEDRLELGQLIKLHKQGLILNATVVQDKYVRGINWTIPSVGILKQLNELRETSITIDKDYVITVGFTCKNLNLTEKVDDIVDSTSHSTVGNTGCGVRFSNKDPQKIVNLMAEILGNSEKVGRVNIKLFARGSSSSLEFKVKTDENNKRVAISKPEASKNAHICVKYYGEILNQLLILMTRADLAPSVLANEIMKTVNQYRKEEKPAIDNNKEVATSNGKVTNLETVGITIESYEDEMFVTCEIVAEDIKVPEDVKHKLDSDSTSNYIKYTIDETAHASAFLRSFLRGIAIPKMAIVLVDRVMEDEENKIFFELDSNSKDVVCKVNGKGRDAVDSGYRSLDDILVDLVRHKILDANMYSVVSKECKKHTK